MLLRLDTQSVFERMIPQFFHQIPIFNEPILDRIFDLHVILSIFECRCADAVANIAACCCACRGAAWTIHVHLFTCARRPLPHDTILSWPHHPNRLPPKQKPVSASRGRKRARVKQTQRHQQLFRFPAGERDLRRPWGRRLWGCPLQQSPPCSCCSPHRPQSPRPHLSPPAPPKVL